MTDPQPVRRFLVHDRDLGRRHALLVEEASAEAAAVAYAEGLAALDGAEISLIVRDLDDGCEHCICLDLETGETADCA
ncbi:DUF5961 family protein [Phenylobacterium sp.]|uniref:DUF5961 family protein n=1 Tax=Phenylobacterium sp. TaxID=1871053 RepID=UPI00301C12E0